MNDEVIKSLARITDEEKRILENNSNIDRDLYMAGEKNVINSEKLLSQGKLITVRPHTRFVHFPEHTHDYVEVIYMCTGKTEHIINGEHIVLNEGELLFLSQNAHQEILPAGENDIAVNFIILPEFFDKAILMLEDDETPLKMFLIDCLKNKSSKTPFLHFRVADILPIQNLVENLIWTLLISVTNKRSIIKTTMGLLILQLINYTDKIAYKNEDDQIAMTVLSYIEENYKNGSLKILSELTHYDFAWLSREIKRKTGETYTELLQKKRMSQAVYLLKNTNINVDEISHQIGYDNISYFHRLFHKTYGTTPKTFRTKSKEKTL